MFMSFAVSHCEVIKANRWCIYRVYLIGTSSALEGSGLNDIFHLTAFIWVTNKRKKRSVISEDLQVTFKVSRNFVNKNKKTRNNRGPKLSLEGQRLAPSAIQVLEHLKPLFETWEWENLRFHKSVIWKLVPHAKPYQRL